MKITNIFIVLILLIFSISSCSNKNQNSIEFLKLTGPYLGQKPPGMKPEIFAPGIVNTEDKNHSCVTISPDMKEIYWSLFSHISGVRQERIWYTKMSGRKWTQPEVAPFSGTYREGNPHFSPDGKRLYFTSCRPIDENDESIDANIWYIEKTNAGWSKPQFLGLPVNTEYQEWFPTVAKNRNIYYMFRWDDDVLWDIYRSKFINGEYTTPERLGDAINTRYVEGFSYIDPDERFIIFHSERPGGYCENGELYISFRKKDGTWADAKNMGQLINSVYSRFPGISPDGQFFFFSNQKNDVENIYWVDAKIIEELKPAELK